MCGIAGFSLSETEPELVAEGKDERDRPTTLAYDLAYELLDNIESRGRDATGWAQPHDDAVVKVRYRKQPLTASEFLKQGHLFGVDQSSLILHTRFGTGGSEMNEKNNHPVIVQTKARTIVGVHNGIISNADTLFRDKALKLPDREGEVDTEALFALIAMGGPVLAGEKARGRAAVAWLDTTNNNLLHLANFGGSPLVIGETEAGSIIFASTKQAIEDAVKYADLTKLQHLEELAEGRYTAFQAGKCVVSPRSVGVITPPPSTYSYSSARKCSSCKETLCVCRYSNAPLAPYPERDALWPDAPKGAKNGQIITLSGHSGVSRVLGGAVVPYGTWDTWRTATDKLKDDKAKSGTKTTQAPRKDFKVPPPSVMPIHVCNFDQLYEDATFPWSRAMWRATEIGTKLMVYGKPMKHATLGTLKSLADDDTFDERRVVLYDVRLALSRAGSMNQDGIFKLGPTAEMAKIGDLGLPVGTVFTDQLATGLFQVTGHGDSYERIGTYYKCMRDLRDLWEAGLEELEDDEDELTHLSFCQMLIDDEAHAPENLLYMVRWQDDITSWFFQRDTGHHVDGKPVNSEWVEHYDVEGELISKDILPGYNDIDDMVLAFIFAPTTYDITYFGGLEPTNIWSCDEDPEKEAESDVLSRAFDRLLNSYEDDGVIDTTGVEV